MTYRFVAGLVALGAFALPAAAADMNAGYGYGYAPAAQPMSWTGFYIGANAGYSWGSSGPYSPGGFLGGLQAGYNWQFVGSPFVAGVETDFDWAGISDGAYSLNYFGTVRARLGFAFERILAYGTLGFAYGGGQFEVLGLSNNQTHGGWTIGAGAEFALDRNWSARAEYLYVDLGSSTYNSLIGPATLGFDGNILRGGVNYRF
ncbi:outer membrane beta-barrel protein [Aquabacter sp. CN5-332]|uniref:outer membrane protein n=1 Tax=Aquabacter sp. CN5-332 TaxID=3156608 RepID=UPI0032B5BDC1